MNQAIKFSTDMGVDENTIQMIAEQYSLDEEIVKGLCESELSSLIKQGVRITAFLPVLCVRRVKDLIITSRNS